jgi:hypothetical protein
MAMKTLGLCLLFCIIGLAEDFIVSKFYLAIAKKQAFRAGGISFILTLLTMFVVSNIVKGDSVPLLLCYATGGWVGTYLGVKGADMNLRNFRRAQ